MEPRWYAEAKRQMERDAQERARARFAFLIAALLMLAASLCIFAEVTSP